MSEAEKKTDLKPAEKKAVMIKDRSWVYSFTRGIAAILFRFLAPVKYVHRERVNELKPPFIFIANHSSMMDPIIMAYSIKKDQVHFLGKSELTHNAFVNWYLTNMHMVPVDRHATDMAAMRTCLRILKEGYILGIFPEGTRHHEGLMTEMEAGTAMIALRSGVPLIPAYLTPRFGLFKRHWCYIGEPIPTDDLRAEGINKETCQKLMNRITEVYARMAHEHEALHPSKK